MIPGINDGNEVEKGNSEEDFTNKGQEIQKNDYIYET